MIEAPKRGVLQAALQPAIALAAAFAIAALIIRLTGGHPGEAFTALWQGAAGNQTSLLRTLAKATPLLFSGLAVAIALRAGLFNIGAEGQLLVGGLAAAVAGYWVKGLPMIVHLPLALGAGVAAGALWAVVPGILKAWRGASEVIVTIMMNYIAIRLTHYLVAGPLKDSSTMATATPKVLESARLWTYAEGGSDFSAGFFLALFAAVAFSFLIKRTALGFEIRAVGQGPDAARAAGISVAATTVKAMLMSGGLAGLAGAVEVLAVHGRFYDSFSPGLGFDSIAVALLGNLNALGIALSAGLFGGLTSGAKLMELDTNIPIQISGIIQGIVIVAVGMKLLRKKGSASG